MLKQKTPFPKKFWGISLRTAILSTLLMVFVSFLYYYFRFLSTRPVILWNHLILLIMIFISVKRYRNIKLSGYINFKESYIAGLFTGVINSVLLGCFIFVYTKYIDKELIKNFIVSNEIAMNNYISGDELLRQKAFLHKTSTPFFMGIRAFGELFLMSIFIPLIVSIVLKKEKRESDVIEEEIVNE